MELRLETIRFGARPGENPVYFIEISKLYVSTSICATSRTCTVPIFLYVFDIFFRLQCKHIFGSSIFGSTFVLLYSRCTTLFDEVTLWVTTEMGLS